MTTQAEREVQPVLNAIEQELAGPNGHVVLDALKELLSRNSDLRHEANIDVSPERAALEQYGHLRVDEVFTEKLCINELGYLKGVRSRILSTSRNCADEPEYRFDTLAELARQSAQQILRNPNFGRTCLHLVEDVLVRYGLRLGMMAALEWCEVKDGS